MPVKDTSTIRQRLDRWNTLIDELPDAIEPTTAQAVRQASSQWLEGLRRSEVADAARIQKELFRPTGQVSAYQQLEPRRGRRWLYGVVSTVLLGGGTITYFLLYPDHWERIRGFFAGTG